MEGKLLDEGGGVEISTLTGLHAALAWCHVLKEAGQSLGFVLFYANDRRRVFRSIR